MSDKLPCGHHESLAVISAETGKFLFCELCDARSARNDAEAMEARYRAQRDRAALYDKLNGTPCAEIRWQQDREELQAQIADLKSDTALKQAWADVENLRKERDDALANSATYECRARIGRAPDPQDCNWPLCGCDPHADKVIAALEESGILNVTAAAEERDKLRRELRKCTISKDEFWKVARAGFAKIQQLKTDGEGVAQMLIQRDKEADAALADASTLRALIARAVAAIEWVTPAMATLVGYERDYGETLPDDWILGRIEESRDMPSFRIRVGHFRRLAALAADFAFVGARPTSARRERRCEPARTVRMARSLAHRQSPSARTFRPAGLLASHGNDLRGD